MKDLTWDASLSVDIQEIDDDHRRLFDYASDQFFESICNHFINIEYDNDCMKFEVIEH